MTFFGPTLRRSSITIAVIFLLSCESGSEGVRTEVEACMKAQVPAAASVAMKFQHYLLEEQLISEWSKAEVLSLVRKQNIGQVSINELDFMPSYVDIMTFYSPSNYSRFLECFGSSSGNRTEGGATMSDVAQRMMVENNIGPPLDEEFISSIDDDQFDTDMARMAVLYIIWPKLRDPLGMST